MDVLQAAARGPRALFGIDIHEMQPYRPLPEQIAEQIAQRPHADRRARLVVPARHRRDQLPRRARQDLDRRRGDRPRRRAAALLPRHRPARARRRGLPRRLPARTTRSPTTCCRPTPSSCASTPATALRARSCATPRASCCARHLAAPPGDQPVRALRRAARARPAAPARGRRRRLPRLRVRDRADGRLGLRGRRVARRLAARRRTARGRATALARIVEGCKALSFRLARRRAFEPAAAVAALAAAWDEAMARLDELARLSARLVAPTGAGPRRGPRAASRCREGWEASPRRLPELSAEPADGARAGWPRARAGHRRRRAARRGRVARGRAARLRRRGLVVSHAASPPSRRADGEQVVLCLDGIATVAEVHLNGERVLDSDSMFAATRSTSARCCARENELAIRCRALAPLLSARRRPRARWRTRLVADGNLRFFRTMLLGRAPGFAPGPAGGRAVARRAPRAPPTRRGRAARAARHASSGRRRACWPSRARLRALDGAPPTDRRGRAVARAAGRCARRSRSPSTTARSSATASCRCPTSRGGGRTRTASRRCYEASADRLATRARRSPIDAGRVGFRSLALGAAPRSRRSSATASTCTSTASRVFARGASGRRSIRSAWRRRRRCCAPRWSSVRDAGMNMLRIPGTERLRERSLPRPLRRARAARVAGLHVRQPRLPDRRRPRSARPSSARRARCSARLGGRPSLAVLCGNSEVEQQVAMLGLEPVAGARRAVRRAAAASSCARAGWTPSYVPSAPCGGELPFRPDRGVANYYGVGGYLRPLEDARRAEVRFAAECLAFANVPDEAAVEAMLPDAAGAARRAPSALEGRACPATSAADWDFEDVRDHYLQLLFGVDPVAAAPRRPRALPRALARGHRRGDGRGVRRVAAGGVALRRRAGAVAARSRRRAPAGACSTTAASPRSPTTTCAARSRRSPCGRPTRASTASSSHVANDRPEPLTRAPSRRLYRDFELQVARGARDARAARARSRRTRRRGSCSAASSTPPGPIASGRPRTTCSSPAWSARASTASS